MSGKVSDSVGNRTAKQTATALTRFFLHALVSLYFSDKAVFLPTWCNLEETTFFSPNNHYIWGHSGAAQGLWCEVRWTSSFNKRGGVTLNKTATHQITLPLLTAWCIKQYTSDSIHAGWHDLASPTVRSNQAVRRPVRGHLRSSRYAICWAGDVAISSVSFWPAVAWAKWDPSQYVSKRNQIRSICCSRSVLVCKLTEGHCVVLLASRLGWS